MSVSAGSEEKAARATGDRNPVLLLHGIGDTETVFRRMKLGLGQLGWEVHVLNLVPNDGRVGLPGLARQVERYVETNFTAAQAIDLVGFSMGGLVARYYLQRLGGINRVERLVTIATPHKGTWTAFLRQNAGTRQMRPGSAFLKELNDDAAVLSRIRFTSIWTPFDLMVVPASSSALAVGRAIAVKVRSHPEMLGSPRVFSLVQEALS